MYACMYVAMSSIECVVGEGRWGTGVTLGSWSQGHAKDCFQFEIHDFALFLVRTLANNILGSIA